MFKIFNYRCQKCGGLQSIIVESDSNTVFYCDKCGGKMDKIPSFSGHISVKWSPSDIKHN